MHRNVVKDPHRIWTGPVHKKIFEPGFQVEVTKFDALEEAHAELKLKQQLWDSIDEWDKLSTDWLSVGRITLVSSVVN